jgi:hypothetical protein
MVAELKEFLTSEMERINQYEKDTATMANVVVVGPKPAEDYITEQQLLGFMGNTSPSLYKIFPRGKKGVFAVVFYSVPPTGTSPGTLGVTTASNFKSSFERRFPEQWAVLDQNRILREGKTRARGFGNAYKTRHGNAFWRIVDNLLIIDDIVLGPVTLIPGNAHWKKLAAFVSKARSNRKRSFSYDKKPTSQVHLRIFAFCTAIYRTPEFLDDGDNSSIGTEAMDDLDEEDLDFD